MGEVSIRTYLMNIGMCEQCVNRYTDNGTAESPCATCFTKIVGIRKPSNFIKVGENNGRRKQSSNI